MYRIRIESVTRRPQTSVRGKFLFHYSNDHKMSAYCSFFNILVSPPAAGLIFCTILAKLLAVRINLLWILFALGLLIHARLMKSKTWNKGQCRLRHYNKSNWLPFIQQPINKKSGKGHMSLRVTGKVFAIGFRFSLTHYLSFCWVFPTFVYCKSRSFSSAPISKVP